MDLNAIIAMVVSIALGVSLVWNKAEKILHALKELADVLVVIAEGLSDQTLTAEEIELIKKEAGEAIAAFKAILK
jgi:hypothetical protein